ncbi:MAG TPA: Fe-Mn family superoxide dismutase [Polyangia bacterium]
MISRRDVLVQTGSALALLGGVGNAVARAEGKREVPAGVPMGKHAMVPLPFDAKKLKGLSEHMVTSHHDNNYAGAVANLNRVEDELSRIRKETPGYLVAGLRERELTYTNSLVLHEHYFANLGGNGKPDGAIAKALGDAFAGHGRWEELFRATGLSLSGGSGWTLLDYNFHSNDLRTYWSGNHTQQVAFGAPLLVMDMYEHAYQMDFGAAAAKYVDAFFANINWDEVNRRYERALGMARAS